MCGSTVNYGPLQLKTPVTGETRKLEGVVPAGALISADPNTTIENLIKDWKPAAV